MNENYSGRLTGWEFVRGIFFGTGMGILWAYGAQALAIGMLATFIYVVAISSRKQIAELP